MRDLVAPVARSVRPHGEFDGIEAGANRAVPHRVHVDQKTRGVEAAHDGIERCARNQQIAARARIVGVGLKHRRRVHLDLAVEKDLGGVRPKAPPAHAIAARDQFVDLFRPALRIDALRRHDAHGQLAREIRGVIGVELGFGRAGVEHRT